MSEVCIDKMLLELDFGGRIRVARQLLSDIIDDLALDEPPSAEDGDVLPVLEAARDVLEQIEAPLT